MRPTTKTLLPLLLGLGCGRSDPFAFDRFTESAGEGGTSTGRQPSAGSSTGGVGAAGCSGRLALCGDACVDLLSDELHCGRCFAACNFGSECFDARCDSPCPGAALCSGSCVDLSSDSQNCGLCGNYCVAGSACVSGACRSFCGPDSVLCGVVCVDPARDALNCGGCGFACSAGLGCSLGQCLEPPDTGYAVSVSPLMFMNACNMPNAISALRAVDDDVFAGIDASWFNYFGIPRRFAWVSSNGVLGFGDADTSFSNECSFVAIPYAVFAFWDDLVTGPSGVCMAAIGTAPNRQFVATWDRAAHLEAPESTSLSFSIVLSEGTNTIDVLYATMSGGSLAAGASATIGLSGSSYYALDCCEAACIQSYVGRRYTPRL